MVLTSSRLGKWHHSVSSLTRNSSWRATSNDWLDDVTTSYDSYGRCVALSKETSKLLVHALIISRLDYCNSVFNNVAAVHLHPLQSVLHAAARLVVQRRKYNPITADIRDYLHSLLVNYRNDFKLCALVYKCLHRSAPVYLSDMCTLISTNPTPSQRWPHRSSHTDSYVRPSQFLFQWSNYLERPTYWHPWSVTDSKTVLY